MVDTINFYYAKLIDTFGRIEYNGCYILAYMLAAYKPGIQMQEIYKAYSDESGLSPAAIERAVRNYLAVIVQDYGLETISEMINYPFKPGQTKLKSSEFIPILKYRIDNEKHEG